VRTAEANRRDVASISSIMPRGYDSFPSRSINRTTTDTTDQTDHH